VPGIDDGGEDVANRDVLLRRINRLDAEPKTPDRTVPLLFETCVLAGVGLKAVADEIQGPDNRGRDERNLKYGREKPTYNPSGPRLSRGRSGDRRGRQRRNLTIGATKYI
jgi:hypothetical protein